MATPIDEVSALFYSALNAVLAGDPEPMYALWSHADDATYMSPFGEILVGWDDIRGSWQKQAEMQMGGDVQAVGLHHLVGTDVGVAVGFEKGTVNIGGTPTTVDIRATSTYRLENGVWQMVGHHTDPLG